MGRKKRNLDYVKPFCFYCDRVFTNEIVLHQHQKAIHFTCPRCYKKFPSTHNLTTHVHRNHQKYKLDKVPNSLRERENPSLNIFGMTGVPNNFIETRMFVKGKEYWKHLLEQRKGEREKEAEEIKEEDK